MADQWEEFTKNIQSLTSIEKLKYAALGINIYRIYLQ